MRMLKPTQTRQPAGPAAIDWGNPLARGLIFATNGHGDAQTSMPLQFAGNATLLPTFGGSAYGGFARTATNYVRLPGANVPAGAFTVLALVLYSGEVYPVNQAGVFVSNGGVAAGGGGFKIGLSGNVAASQPRFALTFGGVADYSASTASMVTGQINAVGCVVTGAAGTARYFLNGSFDSSRTVGTRLTASAPITLGTSHNGSGYVTNDTLNTSGVVFAAVWNRALTDDEIAQVSRNPWQLFQPQRSLWAYGAAGGGGGNTFNQTAIGSLTLFSDIYKSSLISKRGSITASGQQSKFINKTGLVGSITSTGTVLLGGTLSYLATGSITVVGVLADAVNYVRSYTSSITLTGSPFRLINKLLQGAVTLTGIAKKGMYIFLQSAVALAGALASFKFTPTAGNVITQGLRFMKRFIGRR